MTEKERKTVESDQRVDTDRIFTLPNVLSIFRLLLIPLIIYFYETYHYNWAFGTLVLSGATDVVDGWIARTFHLVSDFGKAIDPIADKLTQIAILLCLMPMQYCWVVGVVVFKEVTIGLLTLTAIRRTRRVYSAGWYGKLCTVLIYLSMFVLMLWRNPNPTFVLVDCIAICCAVTLSFCKYFHYFMGILRENRRQKDSEKA